MLSLLRRAGHYHGSAAVGSRSPGPSPHQRDVVVFLGVFVCSRTFLEGIRATSLEFSDFFLGGKRKRKKSVRNVSGIHKAERSHRAALCCASEP